MTAELRQLLDALGRDPDERIAVCADDGGGFRSELSTVEKAHDVAGPSAGQDCWFSVQPIHPKVMTGRGTAKDVIGLRVVYCDLDVKSGGMPDLEAARLVISDLSKMLGVSPVGIVSSGHGLQPHWRIERDHATDWPDEGDSRWSDAGALLRRWGRLVATVAEAHGGQVDNVYDLARVLRTPGTTNCKAEPVPTKLTLLGGAPVSVEQIIDTLDGYGIAEFPEDRETLGEIVAEVDGWAHGPVTCRYVTQMVAGWRTDTPTARHPWLVSQSIRLAAAHRAGCITEGDHHAAVDTLTDRFRSLLTTPPVRREQPGEITSALRYGIAKIETKTDVEVRRDELGDHNHPADVTVLDAALHATEGDDPQPIRTRFPRLDWHALWADESTEEWILEPILPARRSVTIYSPPKAGKSLITLEIAAGLATGRRVLGVLPHRAFRVLYVDFENDAKGDVRERLKAMGYGPDDLDLLDYLSFPSLAALDSDTGGRELMQAVTEYGSDVVIIDTVSRAVAGEENSNDTWLSFYRHTGRRLKQAQVACLRLDHTGKDETKGMRGGSAKSGDVDAVWRLTQVVQDRTYRLDLIDHRMPVAEQTLTLHREVTPVLHHVVDARGRAAAFDAKVDELIRLADTNALPYDANRETLRSLAKDHGMHVGTEVLGQAIKGRKLTATLPVSLLPDPPETADRHVSGHANGDRHEPPVNTALHADRKGSGQARSAVRGAADRKPAHL